MKKKNKCHVPYFKGIHSYTLPHFRIVIQDFFLLNDFIQLTWNIDGEIISMPCKVVVTLSGVCTLWRVRGLMLMECWLLSLCVFVLHDRIINGQMHLMICRLLESECTRNKRMKHAITTSCKLRVLCAGVKWLVNADNVQQSRSSKHVSM